MRSVVVIKLYTFKGGKSKRDKYFAQQCRDSPATNYG